MSKLGLNSKIVIAGSSGVSSDGELGFQETDHNHNQADETDDDDGNVLCEHKSYPFSES